MVRIEIGDNMLGYREVEELMFFTRVFSSKKALQMLLKLYDFGEPLNVNQLSKSIIGKPATGCTWYNAMNILEEGGYVSPVKNKYNGFKKFSITERGIILVQFLENISKFNERIINKKNNINTRLK